MPLCTRGWRTALKLTGCPVIVCLFVCLFVWLNKTRTVKPLRRFHSWRLSFTQDGLACFQHVCLFVCWVNKTRAVKPLRHSHSWLIDVAFITLRNNLVALLETLYTGISFLDSRRSVGYWALPKTVLLSAQHQPESTPIPTNEQAKFCIVHKLTGWFIFLKLECRERVLSEVRGPY